MVENRSPARSLRPALVLGILVLGILASLLAGRVVRDNIEQNALRRFAAVCDAITLKVRERLTAYAVLLQGGQGLFAASDSVERDEWRRYVGTLQAEEIVPGFEGIGYAALIAPAGLADHIAAVRREGFAGYTVKPASARDVYSSIIYLGPFAGRNLRAFGYDMFSEPVRRAAMEQARDTGRAALSGKVTLVQEGDGDAPQTGALMYVPVYRNDFPRGTVEERRAALAGWVYSPYRMRDLMSGIVPDWEILGGELLDLHVYDGDRPESRHLLFDSHPAGRPQPNPSFLHLRRTVEFNGRRWLLVFDGGAAVAALSYRPARFATAAGLVISGLLFGMLIACKPACAKPTPWPVSAATNSSSCFPPWPASARRRAAGLWTLPEKSGTPSSSPSACTPIPERRPSNTVAPAVSESLFLPPTRPAATPSSNVPTRPCIRPSKGAATAFACTTDASRGKTPPRRSRMLVGKGHFLADRHVGFHRALKDENHVTVARNARSRRQFIKPFDGLGRQLHGDSPRFSFRFHKRSINFSPRWWRAQAWRSAGPSS